MSQLSTDQWKSVQLTRLKDSSVMQSHNIFKKGIQFSPPPTNYCTSHGELIFWTRIFNNYNNWPFHWSLSQNQVKFSKKLTLHNHSIIMSHFIQSMDNATFLYRNLTQGNQNRVVTFNVPQLTQASSLQKKSNVAKVFFYICNAEIAQSLSSLQNSEFLKLIILIFHVKKLNN